MDAAANRCSRSSLRRDVCAPGPFARLGGRHVWFDHRHADGGKTWKQQESKTSAHLFSIAFANAKNGVAVGSRGTILMTTDGGAEWKPIKS